MQRLGRYAKNDIMSELVGDNYRILLVMSRFGIGMGFGDKSIDEVCRENDVDTETFLALTNLLVSEDAGQHPAASVSVGSLLTYLQRSHEYFLDFRLPAIRAKLVGIIGKGDHLSRMIVKYFDDYMAGVDAHMKYEEKVVFPYVCALLEGDKLSDYSIDVFQKRHDQIETLLTEFKNILIKYFPSKSTNEINDILFDIFNCEEDLASHNAVEDLLFVPAVRQIEQKTEGKR